MTLSGVPTFFFLEYAKKNVNVYLGCQGQTVTCRMLGGTVGILGETEGMLPGTVGMLSRIAGMLWVGKLGC